MNQLYHTIIGLPRSGKTTFLAALWHLLDAGEVETQLRLDELRGDVEYLNRIAEEWRRCETVQRTSIAQETNLSIRVKNCITGQKIVLEFPDLSGESFHTQFTTRTCRKEYLEGINTDGGILLFVNADRPIDGLTHLDMASIPGNIEGLKQNEQHLEWSALRVPESVKLVDLLQFITMPPFTRRQRKLAVIVSAWDLIPVGTRTPTEWLSQELPLLFHFLQSNLEYFQFRVYGVSAQGGILPEEHGMQDEKRLELARKTPSERLLCVGQDATPHDLTAPLVWLSEA